MYTGQNRESKVSFKKHGRRIVSHEKKVAFRNRDVLITNR